MEHIAGQLAKIERNIEIVGADPITQHGFTMVPNAILTHKDLSVSAKMTYAMLLKYCWQNNYCFPGQEKLAEDIGSGVRSVVRFMAELERSGYIAVERRGLGKTNIYRLFLVVDKSPKRAKRG